MNKTYFKQSLKANYKSMLFIFIIGLIIYPLIIAINDYDINSTSYYLNKPCDVGYAITYLALLCYIVPIFKCSYLQKKKTVDTYFSLPIKRINLLNTNLLIGFLQIFIPYTIVYFLGFGVMCLKVQQYNMFYYIPLYFLSVIIALCIYLFNFFICSRANNIVDSVIYLILYTFVFTIIFYLLLAFEDFFYLFFSTSQVFQEIEQEKTITFYVFIGTGNHFADLINNVNEDMSYGCIIFTILLGIGGYLGLYFTNNYDKAERAEQISQSWFGYRILIPIYYVCLLVGLSYQSGFDISYIYYCFLTVAALIGYMIYYRKFRLPKKIYLLLGICLVASLTFCLVYYEFYSKLS